MRNVITDPIHCDAIILYTHNILQYAGQSFPVQSVAPSTEVNVSKKRIHPTEGGRVVLRVAEVLYRLVDSTATVT